MKIGVISDTHMVTGKLPQAVVEAFQGVDRILHAGDLVTLSVVDSLEAIAPVTAVCGNMDMPGVRVKLPLRSVIEVDGHRIGLIHGHHVPHPGQVLKPPEYFVAIDRYLLTAFQEEVDCIVYGHTHYACHELVAGVHILNPGSPTHGKDGRLTVAVLDLNGPDMVAEIVDLA